MIYGVAHLRRQRTKVEEEKRTSPPMYLLCRGRGSRSGNCGHAIQRVNLLWAKYVCASSKFNNRSISRSYNKQWQHVLGVVSEGKGRHYTEILRRRYSRSWHEE